MAATAGEEMQISRTNERECLEAEAKRKKNYFTRSVHCLLIRRRPLSIFVHYFVSSFFSSFHFVVLPLATSFARQFSLSGISFAMFYFWSVPVRLRTR